MRTHECDAHDNNRRIEVPEVTDGRPGDTGRPTRGAGAEDEQKSALRKQQEEWCTAFLSEHWKALVTHIERGPETRNSAEDHAQRAMMTVLRWWEQHPESGRPSPKRVFAVAANIATRASGEEQRRDEQPVGLVHEDDLPDETDHSARLVAEAVLNRVKPQWAEAFRLHRIAKYTSTEAGVLLGLPASSVRWMAEKAAEAIRRELDERKGRPNGHR